MVNPAGDDASGNNTECRVIESPPESPPDSPPPTDCIGEWSTCTVDCTKTYTITTEASGGGNSCSNVNNETADCAVGEGECPLISQQDQESSVTTARETTETVSGLQASLSSDPTNETLQEELRAAVQTQTEAIQSTNTVIQESIAGEGNAIQEEIQKVNTARENVDQARNAYENASEEEREVRRQEVVRRQKRNNPPANCSRRPRSTRYQTSGDGVAQCGRRRDRQEKRHKRGLGQALAPLRDPPPSGRAVGGVAPRLRRAV